MCKIWSKSELVPSGCRSGLCGLSPILNYGSGSYLDLCGHCQKYVVKLVVPSNSLNLINVGTFFRNFIKTLIIIKDPGGQLITDSDPHHYRRIHNTLQNENVRDRGGVLLFLEVGWSSRKWPFLLTANLQLGVSTKIRVIRAQLRLILVCNYADHPTWTCTRWWRSWGVWGTPCDRRTCSRRTSALPKGWRKKSCVVDPDPHWVDRLGSGFVLGMRILGNWPKETNKPGFMLSKKAFVPLRRYVFDILPTLSQNFIFCEFKVWPGSKYPWIRIGLIPWIKIQESASR